MFTPTWPNIGEMSPEHTYYVGHDRTNGLQVFDMAGGKQLGRFLVPGNRENAGQGFFSPGGKFFVFHFEDASGKYTLNLYSVPSCKLLCELPPMAYATTYLRSDFAMYRLCVRAIAFTDELVAFMNGKDQRIDVVDTASGQVRQRLGTPRPAKLQGAFLDAFPFDIKLSLSPDNKSLAFWSSEDRVVRIWDLATAKERMPIVPNDLRDLPVALAWSPDSRTLAVTGLTEPGKIQLWEVASRKVRRELAGHDG
jgi:WD40 repeat protein